MTKSAARIDTSTLAAVVPRRSRKPRPRSKPAAGVNAARFKFWMTVTLGVGIPCLSLALAKMAGTLAANGMYPLAAFAFALMVAVLGVSLSHLAWAVGNVTRSPWRASWALAVALDLSLVLCELCHVYAEALALAWVSNTVMGCVALTSMALNVWAFLMHE